MIWEKRANTLPNGYTSTKQFQEGQSFSSGCTNVTLPIFPVGWTSSKQIILKIKNTWNATKLGNYVT